MNTLTISPTKSGLGEAILSALLLIGITWFFPSFFKTWFVEPTGNIKIATAFGFIFSIGLLFRAHWALIGSKILAWSLLVVLTAGMFISPEKPGFWITAVMDAFLLYLLHSGRMKQFMQHT